MAKAEKKQNPAGISKENGQARTKKGSKAREKIKAAALVLFETHSYKELRVVDITKEAGVATGLFYHYFKDLPSLAQEVLEGFVGKLAEAEAIEEGIAKGDWYARIYAYNSVAVNGYASHPGLMRSLFQLADDNAEFSSMLRNNFVEQLMWLVDVMPHLFPEAELNQQQRLLVIYSLAASSEVLLRDYFVNQVNALSEQELNAEQLTELLSVMFYRGLFLENPPADRLKHFPEMTLMRR